MLEWQLNIIIYYEELNRMGYQLTSEGFDSAIKALSAQYRIWAPVNKKGAGRHEATDVVIYDEVHSGSEIEFNKKSDYAFKEAILPLSETLFYFTENQFKEADFDPKPILIFARSCDIQALKRLDQIYLENGRDKDPFYDRKRKLLNFALIGCQKSFENCFCISMGSNKTSEGFLFACNVREDGFEVDTRESSVSALFKENAAAEVSVSADFVTENKVKVNLPEAIPLSVIKAPLWDEYNTRCIGCGRCNFVCPTCSCYTMQDIFYTDNGKVGERRRVAASCMVDGFTNVAGGGQYRKTQGERMRFKVLHKIGDHKARFGINMCVGCGRCDDVCPEYISYSNIINKVSTAVEEAKAGENK